MDAISYGMSHLASGKKVEKEISGVLIEGVKYPNETRWDLPELPNCAELEGVRQSFETPENALLFWEHYCREIDNLLPELEKLKEQIKTVFDHVPVKHWHWTREHISKKPPSCIITVKNTGTGNDFFPDQFCETDDFVAQVKTIVWATGFSGYTAEEVINKIKKEVERRL